MNWRRGRENTDRIRGRAAQASRPRFAALTPERPKHFNYTPDPCATYAARAALSDLQKRSAGFPYRVTIAAGARPPVSSRGAWKSNVLHGPPEEKQSLKVLPSKPTLRCLVFGAPKKSGVLNVVWRQRSLRTASTWDSRTLQIGFKNTHRVARTHDHKVKSLALCRLS